MKVSEVKKVSYKRMEGKDRKKQILRIAQHVFAEDNYYGATIARIAHAADVTEPTIYLYFKDKRDLFMAVVEGCASFQLSAMKLIIDGTNDLKQAGLNLIREDHRFITQVTSDVEKIMNMARVINDPEIKARVRRFNTEIHSLLAGYIEKAMAEGVIRDDVDPRVLARILMGVVAAMRTMLLVESPEDVEKIFMDAAEFLEKVILKH